MTRRSLERDRCEGCGRFHQDLSHDEDSGLALCEECIVAKYGPPPVLVKSVRVKDATPEQIGLCSCDVCGRVVQTRGWINPERVELVRRSTGSFVHGRCL